MSKDNVVIYWASEDGMTSNSEEDWGILNRPINSVFSVLVKDMASRNGFSYFNCPSVKNLLKQTFIISSPTDSSYIIDNNSVELIGKHSLYAQIAHSPSINNNQLFIISRAMYFFCEEDVEITLSAPYFNHAPHMQYGAVVPGKMNIGAWFRTINIEINLWDGVKEFSIKENEPLAYVNFNTEKNIIMKQFKMNRELTKVSRTCAQGATWEPNVPLLKRYKRFKESKTNVFVLQQIKNNLLESENE